MPNNKTYRYVLLQCLNFFNIRTSLQLI